MFSFKEAVYAGVRRGGFRCLGVTYTSGSNPSKTGCSSKLDLSRIITLVPVLVRVLFL